MDNILRKKDEQEVDSFPWGSLTWFARGSMGHEITLGFCRIASGMSNPMHYHPNCTEILHVLSGTIMHSYEGREEMQMEAGDTITIESGKAHNARNVGDCEALMSITFTTDDRKTVHI